MSDIDRGDVIRLRETRVLNDGTTITPVRDKDGQLSGFILTPPVDNEPQES